VPFWQGWSPDSDHPWAAHFKTKVTIPSVTGTMQVISGFGTVLGLVVEEPTGTNPVRFELWDGSDTGGEYMGAWTLLSGQSIDNTYTVFGLVFRNGLFLNVTTGSVKGVAYIGTLVPWPRVHAGED
jgi:hypothetical protein